MTPIDIDGKTMKEIEQLVILIKFEQFKNYTRVAKELGIGRTTLWRRTKEYAQSES